MKTIIVLHDKLINLHKCYSNRCLHALPLLYSHTIASHTLHAHRVAWFSPTKKPLPKLVERKFLICTAGKPLSTWFNSNYSSFNYACCVCVAVKITGSILFNLQNHKRKKRINWILIYLVGGSICFCCAFLSFATQFAEHRMCAFRNCDGRLKTELCIINLIFRIWQHLYAQFLLI